MRSLKSIHTFGAIFVLVFGTLLHFTWEWFGKSNAAAVFSAVNESTWEHLKLIFFPFVLFSAIEYIIYGKQVKCFFTIKFQAVLLGMFTIVVAFYTYTGILGTNYLLLDIGTFVLGVLASYNYSYKSFERGLKSCQKGSELVSFIGIIALITAFVIFTFYPPNLGIFKSPV